MKEMLEIYRSETFKNGDYTVEMVEDSIYNWNVELRSIDKDSALYKDLMQLKEKEGVDFIQLNMTFNDKYPIEPPFVRVVYPILMCKQQRIVIDYLVACSIAGSQTVLIVIVKFVWIFLQFFLLFAHTGKHVVGGGAICTELLLKQCWSPGYTIESVIIQMAALFVKGNARIDFKAPRNQVFTQIESRIK